MKNLPIMIALSDTPINPRSIANLTLWMDAGDLSGADGSAVAAWVSKEGNAYSFAQADGAKQPLLRTGANGINGRNVVQFDGSNDLLVLPSAPLTGTEGTVFAVYRLASTPTFYQHVLSSSDEATTSGFMRFMAYYSSTGQLAVAQTGPDEVRGETVHTAGAVYCAMWKSSGIAYTMRLNKADETLTVAGGSNAGDWFGDTTGRDNTVLGALKRTTEGSFLKGDLAEILVYSTALTAAQIARVESYLERRYGSFFAPSQFIQSYGGAGNDSTDNYFALTNAIAAMSAAGGGTIYLPAGTYRITAANITWASNVSLVGDGIGKSIIRLGNGRQFVYTGDLATPLSNCLFRDIELNGALHTGWYKGFFFLYCENILWYRVKVANTGATGFGSDYMVNCQFVECIADNCGQANTIETPGCSGFGIGTGKYEVESVSLINCTATNNKRYGAFFEVQGTPGISAYRSKGCRIIGGTFSGNQWGVGDCGCDGMLLDGATVTNNIAEGVYVGGPSLGNFAGINGTIQNCTITGNGGLGIRPETGGTGYTLTNNTLSGNGA